MARKFIRQVRGDRTDGARLLDALLHELDVSLPTWSEDNGIDRQQAGRVLAGDVKEVGIDFAFAVQDATEGRIDARSFLTKTRRSDEDATPAPPKTKTRSRSRAR
jgi:hypothetical protein